MNFDIVKFFDGFFQAIEFFLHALLYIVPIYIFLLRFAKAEFARKIKFIVDEVLKINDLCIDFFGKYQEYLILIYEIEKEETDKSKVEEKINKLVYELHIIVYQNLCNAVHTRNDDRLYAGFTLERAVFICELRR